MFLIALKTEFQIPISYCVIVTKPRSSCYELPLKPPGEDKEATEKATAAKLLVRFAYFPVAAVLSEMDEIFTLFSLNKVDSHEAKPGVTNLVGLL